MTTYDVTIVGAGPYGLSAGAFLKSMGLGVRVFGKPMEFWAEKMPKACCCARPGKPPILQIRNLNFHPGSLRSSHGNRAPVAPLPLETFVKYGQWFQQQLRSGARNYFRFSVNLDGNLFRIITENGETVTSRKVVIAAGVGPFNRKPAALSQLSSDHASHCYEGKPISELAGKRVAVVGAGRALWSLPLYCTKPGRTSKSLPGSKRCAGLECTNGCISWDRCLA